MFTMVTQQILQFSLLDIDFFFVMANYHLQYIPIGVRPRKIQVNVTEIVNLSLISILRKQM